MAVLEVRDLHVNYGQVAAVRGIDLAVEEGEVVALLGANGAGKTSTLRAITGLARVAEGSVRYRGQEISNRPPHSIMRMGISHVPQGRLIFADQTVHDNLLLGSYSYYRRDKQKVAKLIEREFERFPVLGRRRKQQAGTLSGGEQQMLAISRALMSEAQFLALDEPSLGLAPLLVKQIMEAIAELNRHGTTILLVEQMAMAALGITHRAYVLQSGVVTVAGTAQELLTNQAVVESYLGGGVSAAAAEAAAEATLEHVEHEAEVETSPPGPLP